MERLCVYKERRFVMAGGKPVAGERFFEKYFEVDGLLSEIKRQLRHKDGYTGDIDALSGHLQLAVEREFVSPLFKRDMRKERGYKLIEEGSQHPEGVAVADLERKEFFNFDESYITGKELQKRARKLNANLGQHTAEYLLEHQDEISEDWRDTYLVFPGTVWRRSGDIRLVPCLHWYDGRWSMRFLWLDYKLFSGDRLVRVRDNQ